MLIEVSAILKKHLPAGSHAIRWGGEEFLILLVNVSTSEADLYRSTIQDRISRIVLDDLAGFTVSIATGMVRHESSRSIDDTIAMADRLMYENKAEMKERVRSKR